MVDAPESAKGLEEVGTRATWKADVVGGTGWSPVGVGGTGGVAVEGGEEGGRVGEEGLGWGENETWRRLTSSAGLRGARSQVPGECGSEADGGAENAAGWIDWATGTGAMSAWRVGGIGDFGGLGEIWGPEIRLW